MNIAIAGFDTEGVSSFSHFSASKNTLTILDQDSAKQIPAGANAVLGKDYLQDLGRFDLIVRTAGLPPRTIFDANPGLSPDKITSQVNEFFRLSPTRNIIGVTGTKGKGTTSTLIANMLIAAGKDVHLAGNIGVPALSLLPRLSVDSWIILELSSFQLSDIKHSPSIGVCLMVVPEHLNWHDDFLDYTSAKAQMFARQTATDTAIYFAENSASKAIATSGHAAAIPYFAEPGATVSGDTIMIDGQEVCEISEIQLLGAHNLQNVCAAVTCVWQITQDIPAIRSVLTTFSGLEHRLEHVAEIDNVRYYDDSFGTTPETAIVAMQAFAAPKILLLGGSDKGASYVDLAAAVQSSNVKHVLLLGDQASRIQAELEAVGYNDFSAGGESMTKIVANAQLLAASGDVVLLSTACASFGMFKDYKDRGDQFKASVLALRPATGSAYGANSF